MEENCRQNMICTSGRAIMIREKKPLWLMIVACLIDFNDDI